MANKTLVMYFSSTGHTRRAADIIAQKLNADTYEIKAENPYTPADLDWNDPGSRANREQNDGGSRPAYQGELPDISRYDTVIIGHPTWWGIPPRIIETVIGHMDFTGKTVATFSTSGGSGYSGAQQIMDRLLGPDVKPGAVLSSPASVDAWLKQAGLE